MLIESFINKGKLVKGIDFNYYIFDANNEAYEKMMGPIENVEYFAKMGLYGILIAGAIILSLIAMLAIKDRKYELGVLLSLGESKIKLIGQLVIETIIILILSFIIAFPVSSVTSNSVGNILLNNELEIQTKETSESPRGFMRSDPMLNNVETIDKLDVSISNDVIFQLFGLGIMIAVISTIIPSISILRYNPKTILTKAD